MIPAEIIPVTKVLAYIIFILLGIWCWFQWKYQREIRSAVKLYPTKFAPLPFIGHGYLFMYTWKRVTGFIMEAVVDSLSKGISTFCFWCGPLPLTVLLDQEDIQKVLTSSSTSEKGDEMQFMDYILGHGMITAPNSVWKVKRRYIYPLFHPRNVEQLMPMFNRNCRELVLNLSHYEGTTVEFLHHALKISLKSVGNLVFGSNVNFDTESEEFQGLLSVIQRVLELFIKQVLRPWLRIRFLFQFLYKKELSTMIDTSETFTDKHLKQDRKNKLNNQKQMSSEINGEQISESLVKGPLNLLDVYENLKMDLPHVTDKDFKHEVATLYGTGTETVASTVSYILLALAQYPDIQEKLLEEISSVIEDDADVTSEDLGRLSYLDQIFKETLRWSSLIPFITRKALEDVKLSSCTIHAGNTILIGLCGPHKDPKIYHHPEKFDPDRFSPENVSEKTMSCFMPFAVGPRNCIGKVYGEVLIKTMVIHVLRQFKVSTSMDIHTMKKTLVVALIGSEGYNIKIEKRNAKQKNI